MKLSLAKNDKINSYNVNVEIKSVSDPQAQPHFLTNGKWLKNTSRNYITCKLKVTNVLEARMEARS